MRFPRRLSSVDAHGSSQAMAANAFPQEIFYDDRAYPVPAYLEAIGEPASSPNEEADAAAGGATDVLRRVSSFNFMSRVSSHLPSVASGLSLVDNAASSSSRLDRLASEGQGLSSSPADSTNTSRSRILSTGSLENQNTGAADATSVPGAVQDPASAALFGTSLNPDGTHTIPSWRLRDRMKTVGVGIVMALNFGTEPPDIIKPYPCAKLQCWMDPTRVKRDLANQQIGERLEAQYARWQQQRTARNVKYRRAIDPTVEDVRALCTFLRRNAKHERVLFHYNGHGVPRPTPKGEIWVFDKSYSEYIPLSVTALRHWLGKPSIIVLDCSSAGVLIPDLTQPLPETPPGTPPTTPQLSGRAMDEESAALHWIKDTIVLCPTSEGGTSLNSDVSDVSAIVTICLVVLPCRIMLYTRLPDPPLEWLPLHPDYPADIFTSCLTTPIQMALRWFVRRNQHSMGSLDPEAVDAIPGQANDRKTPLGELNWIFTAITDTIAWNVLPKPLFQRLFRQDLLVASTVRNFFLADRILRSLNCTPQSYPPMPPGIADHPLWQTWDLACETCLFELMRDGVLGNHVLATTGPSSGRDDSTTGDGASPGFSSRASTPQPQSSIVSQPSNPTASNITESGLPSQAADFTMTWLPSPFFSEHLTGFEIWLEYAERHRAMLTTLAPPEHLPIVLQVLLSQVHRVRALELLRRFLELGPWAVNTSLSLGIFPYIMKLLPSPDYKSLLVNIWANVLKFDPSCQVDLVKDGCLAHFVQLLANWGNPQTGPQEAAKQRTLSAFCLAATCYRFPQAQTECLRQNLHGRCAALLTTFSKLEEQYLEQLRLYQQQEEAKVRVHMSMPRPEPIHLQLLSPVSRMWLCICLGNMVQKSPPVQQEAYHMNMHICLLARLKDDDAHVRAAAAFALGCLLEYTEPPFLPSTPPAMSLGPGLVQNNMAPPTFQPNQNALMQQHTSAGPVGMAPPNVLTASNVLAGRLQPSMDPNFGVSDPSLQGSNMQPVGVPSAQLQLGGVPMQLVPQSQGMRTQLPPLQGGSGRIQPLPHHTNGISAMQQMQRIHQPMQSMQTHNLPQQAGLIPQPSLGQARLPMLLGQQSAQPALHVGLGQHMLGGAQQQLLNQHNILRQQQPRTGMSMLGGPMVPQGGPQLIQGQLAQRLNPGQQPLMMNQMPQAQQGLPPNFLARLSVYEDRRRSDLDTSIAEPLIKMFSDGSCLVRYEAMMAVSCYVEKYNKAFMVIAERGSSLQLGQEKNDTREDKSMGPQFDVPIPNGLNQIFADRLASIWQTLRSVQRSDAHPKIKETANSIIRTVNEKVMDVKLEIQAEKDKKELAESVLAGIAEEETSTNQGFEPRSPEVTDGTRKINMQPQSDGPAHRVPERIALRRATSDQGTSHGERKSNSIENSPKLRKHLGDRDRSGKTDIPKSTFYSWKKNSFETSFDDQDVLDVEDWDPLNPDGIARAYIQHRNYQSQRRAKDLATRFDPLRPKPPQRKQELDLLLEDSDEDRDARATSLKRELKLKETKLLRNQGAKMTSMLQFHSYETVLMVCDDHDGISAWDYERGDCALAYKNGNKTGTRMTSSFWINEQTKSHFFVGCNDGTVRLWGGIVEDDGRLSKDCPVLLSAFRAVSDLQTTDKGSGMICEWQQFNGLLMAGGHSKNLQIWDLHSEKCKVSLETGTPADVTSLTTAWDESLGMMSGGYSGMGPDLVVAGLSNGSLKLFDIRTRNAIAESGARQRRHTTFEEHRGWIVDTFFTSYGGRFEILSGSVSGDIKAWDLRTSSSVRTLDVQRSPMTALAVHKQIPFVATGSQAQFINISTLEGEALQVIRDHDEMANHRIGPVSCLEFHKQKLILAFGAANSLISIYQPKHPSSST